MTVTDEFVQWLLGEIERLSTNVGPPSPVALTYTLPDGRDLEVEIIDGHICLDDGQRTQQRIDMSNPDYTWQLRKAVVTFL